MVQKLRYYVRKGLSANDSQQAEQGIKIFWDAVLCNPDGVLELGVEAKVTLLMHLLGQAKKDDQVDQRIPNVEIAADLIDSVVLQDLASWDTQIKESDYVSGNIKEGIIQHLIKENKNWMSEMSCKLQEKFTKQIKKANNVTIEGVLEILESIINKFSKDEQDQIFNKLVEVIKNHNENKWQLTKKALETLFTMHQKSKLDLDDKQKRELLDVFLITAYDANLIQLSLKGVQEVCYLQENPSFMEIIKTNIKHERENLKAEDVIGTKVKLLDLTSSTDIEFVKDVIHTSFGPYLQNSIRDVRILASKAITEIAIKTNGGNQFTLNIMNLLIPLVKDNEVSEFVSDNMRKLIEKIDHHEAQQLIRVHVKAEISLLLESYKKYPNFNSMATRINRLIKITAPNVDIELCSEYLNSLPEVMEAATGHFGIKEPMKNEIKDLVQISQNNPQLAKSFIQMVMSLYKHKSPHPSRNYGFMAQDIILYIMQLIDKNDVQFLQDVLNMTIPLLGDDNPGKNEAVTPLINHLIRKVNDAFGKKAIEIFSSFLENPSETIRAHFTKAINNITANDNQLPKNTSNNMRPPPKQISSNIQNPIENCHENMSGQTPQIQDLVKELVQALEDFQIEGRESVSENLFDIMKTDKDKPLIVDMVKALAPLLKDSNRRVRETASLMIVQLVKFDDSTKLRREILNELTPLLQDPEIEVRGSVSQCIVNSLTKNHEDTEFARDVVNLLAPLLQGKFQGMTLRHLEEIFEGHKQLVGEILNLLAPLLKASERFSRESACRSILQMMKTIKTPDNQLIKNVLEMFAQLFKDPVDDTKIFVSKQVVELMELADKSDTQLVKDAFDLMISLSKYPYGNVKRDASKSILAFVYRIDPGLSRNAIEALLPNLEEAEEVKIATLECITDLIRNCNKEDIKFINTFPTAPSNQKSLFS